MRDVSVLLVTLLFFSIVSANTEKVIFLGPEHTQIPDAHPNLQDLRLESLSTIGRSSSTLQTYLEVVFPSASSPRGIDYWYLLEDLVPGQRYEVRVCWAAIQPTQFWLETYTLPEVFDSPNLITSLSSYTESKALGQLTAEDVPEVEIEKSQTSSSTLFLRVSAAADFYSSNKTLMSTPPPVLVDLILDPYVLNILPSSLIPTAIYITILAVLSWYLSSYVSAWLSEVIRPDKAHTE